MTKSEKPLFDDLPATLVEEMLNQVSSLTSKVLDEFEKVHAFREEARRVLHQHGILRKERDLPKVSTPTSCGVDGAYGVERMVASDLVAAAAVAVEGLTPPSEKRYWPQPHHHSWIYVEAHHSDTGSILRALMMGMELQLAANAPHGVVLLDGSLTTPLIFFNQALSKISQVPHLQVSHKFQEHLSDFLQGYSSILSASRSDRQWVGVPKYTARNELAKYLKNAIEWNDKAFLSFLLEGGEYTAPLPLQSPSEPWHLKGVPPDLEKDLVEALSRVNVVYFRPVSWMPALRLEMAPSIAQNNARLATVLAAISHQCASPAIMEPYPLYMADRMVKHLSKALPTLRQVLSQQLAKSYEGKVEDLFLALHGYRTEGGV